MNNSIKDETNNINRKNNKKSLRFNPNFIFFKMIFFLFPENLTFLNLLYFAKYLFDYELLPLYYYLYYYYLKN